MTENPVVLTFSIQSGNILTAHAEVKSEGLKTVSSPQLRLRLFNKIAQKNIVEELYRATEGSIEYEGFSSCAREGCDLVFNACFTYEGCPSPLGNMLPVKYYGYQNLFLPEYSYRYSRRVSSREKQPGIFDKLELSLNPKADCKLLEVPEYEFGYRDFTGKQVRYQGETFVNRSGAVFRLGDPITDAPCENGEGDFCWQCHVVYTRKGDEEHREEAYITLQSPGGSI